MNSHVASFPVLPAPKNHRFLTVPEKRSLIDYVLSPDVRQNEIPDILAAFRLDQTKFDAMRRTHYQSKAVPVTQNETRNAVDRIVPSKSLQTEQTIPSVPVEHPLSQKFEKIYTVLFGDIKSFMLSRISFHTREREQRAEDLTQDAFLKLFVALQNDEDPIHDPKAWLMQVARNMLIDSSRRSESRKRQDTAVVYTASPEADPAQQVENAEISERLHRAVSILMEGLQVSDKIILLQKADNRSSKDVAASVHASHGAVDMSYSRSREFFRRTLMSEHAHLVYDFLGAERTHHPEQESTDVSADK